MERILMLLALISVIFSFLVHLDIILIDRSRNLAKVKSLNMVKKHKKATKESKGGIITKEAFMHLSNLKKITESKKVKK